MDREDGGLTQRLPTARLWMEWIQKTQKRHKRGTLDYENDLPIYICQNARAPFEEWWPSTRWYGGAKKDKEP